MKHILLSALALWAMAAYGQQKSSGMIIRELSPEERIVCPAGDQHSNLYLPPGVVEPQAKSGTNEVFKDSLLNVPGEYVPAIDFVLGFLENYFKSEVPINVWFQLDRLDAGVLAAASPAFLVENFAYAPYQNTEYPIAIAEKILGREINRSNQPDIVVTINSEAAWHFKPNDPDGIERTEHDLATVLTHEVLHGLGFFGSGRLNNQEEGQIEGFLGRSHPVAYDRNMMNAQGAFLFEDFESPSAALAEEFTSNDLFYNSESFRATAKPELFAPSRFNQGSSLYHLANVYNSTGNALMTPSINRGELLYFPGQLALNMLYDMGWDATRIIHEPGLFSEDVNAPYEILADVEADSGFNPATFKLHVSRDSFATTDDVISLTFDQAAGMYKAIIPAPGEEAQYQYYFEVVDGRGVARTRPGGGPDFFFIYNYGTDADPPVMSAPREVEVTVLDDSFGIDVTAIDAFSGVSGVDAVIIINGVADTLALEQSEFNNGQTFFGTYEFTRTFVPTDEIRYKFLAVDNSSNANASVFPADSLLWGTYIVDDTPPQLEHDPVVSVTTFDRTFRIKVSTFDNFTGIREVFGVAQINDEQRDTFPLAYAPTLFGDFYEGAYTYTREFEPDDIIRYSIFATDRAFVPNVSVLPVDSAFYRIPIIEIPDPVLSYINDFNAATRDFNGSGFTIRRASGFPDEAIQSAVNPYPEGGPGQVVDFTYELVRPIIVAGSESFIEFDEVVLVEYGEPGSRWPSDRFYDYVIVEARKLRGAEYFPLIAGYDCSADPDWKAKYDSALNSEGISTATPTPDLLRYRKIDIRQRGDFVAGDTILVRFRLFSDNAAAGWGWLIDNLVIQGNASSTADLALAGKVHLYPNPTQDGQLNVTLELEDNYRSGVMTVYNLLGERLLQQPTGRIDKIHQQRIDLSGLNRGMYLLEIRLDQQHTVTRRFIVGE